MSKLARELREVLRKYERSGPGLGGVFRDSSFNNLHVRRPLVDLRKEGDRFILEAEVPGVRKENMEVHIGNFGTKILIRGMIGGSQKDIDSKVSESGPIQGKANESWEIGDGKVIDFGKLADAWHAASVATSEGGDDSESIFGTRTFEHRTQIIAERMRSDTFSRMVSLPRPVESRGVVAKLDHGVLTLTLKLKTAKELPDVVVPVE